MNESRGRPTNVLHSAVMAEMERSSLADTWQKLEKQQSFRPVSKATQRNTGAIAEVAMNQGEAHVAVRV
jgi:hypothetical protein